MHLKDFENIKVELNNPYQPKKWEKSIGFRPKLNEPFYVHWSLLKSKSEYRTMYIKVQCDDCNKIFERRIRDLNPDEKSHLCSTCRKKGNKNGMFGKKNNINQKISTKKWMDEKGNPFTWDSVKIKIKNKEKERIEKIVQKTRGQKRNDDAKNNIKNGILLAIKEGRLKTWHNIKVKNYKGIDYQGSYELNFLKHIESIGKLHLIEKGPIVEYLIDKNKHNYHVDFKIKNTNIIFEIKSKYYWKKDEKINIIKKESAEKLYDYYLVMDNKFDILSFLK